MVAAGGLLVSVVAVSVVGFVAAASVEASAAFVDAAVSVPVVGLASCAAGSVLIVESGGYSSRTSKGKLRTKSPERV